MAARRCIDNCAHFFDRKSRCGGPTARVDGRRRETALGRQAESVRRDMWLLRYARTHVRVHYYTEFLFDVKRGRAKFREKAGTGGPGDFGGLLDMKENDGGIENSCHWILDIGFRENDNRVRKGCGAQNLALLRRLALALLKREKTGKRGIKTKTSRRCLRQCLSDQGSRRR